MFLLFVFVFFPFPEKYDSSKKGKKRMEWRREKIQKKGREGEGKFFVFFFDIII